MSATLAELLAGPETEIVAYAGDTGTTRGELQRAADALAAELRRRDLSGRAIGVLMPNAPAAIAAWRRPSRDGSRWGVNRPAGVMTSISSPVARTSIAYAENTPSGIRLTAIRRRPEPAGEQIE